MGICCYSPGVPCNIVKQWEEHAILRFGKMLKKSKLPGIYLYWPCFDEIKIIDRRLQCRIMERQHSLTKDNIAVDVDGVLYYRIESTIDAIVNVDNYDNATYQTAATAIRDMIGKFTLDKILTQRSEINSIIKEHVTEKVKNWGVHVLAVELKDIQISKGIEKAISREPAAERIKRGRVKLAEAEQICADNMRKAGELYYDTPTGLALRSMSMLYSMSKNDGNRIIFTPKNTKIPIKPLGITSLDHLLQETQEDKPTQKHYHFRK